MRTKAIASEVQRVVEVQMLKSQEDNDNQIRAVSNAKILLHH